MLKSALPRFLVFFFLLGHLGCEDLPAKRGADAALQCSGSRDATEIMFRWEKPDLQSQGYVFFYKHGKLEDELQHDLFKGRVKMQDPKWKETGNFSVILRYVTMNDTGRYECRAGYNSKSVQLLNIVNLTVHPDQNDVTAEPGQNVTLSCQNPNEDLIIAVKWSRTDLKSENVISYQEGLFDHHPSFKGRVHLQDRQMKDGDVSLILNNVTINDTGTYECRVVWNETNRMNRPDLETDPICITNLSVAQGQPGGQSGDEANKGEEKEEEGKKDGLTGLIVGLILAAVFFVAVVGFVYFYKCRNTRTQYQAGAQQQEYEMSENPSEQI